MIYSSVQSEALQHQAQRRKPNLGALIVRIGLGGFLFLDSRMCPPKPCSNYEGLYIIVALLEPFKEPFKGTL